MVYAAKVFNVMIASPGDVASERSIVRDVIYEWNSVHSNSKKFVLLPIGWESHSSPEMGAHPQDIINSQLLERCDLMVGVFWTRLGTPTKTFSSGTVEEIEKHIATGKPVMLYFSSQPVAIDTVDMEQIKGLKEFKESCQQRGLYQSYDSHSDFKEKFYRHLQLKVNEHALFQTSADAGEEIFDSRTSLPALSDEARVLLKAASLDSNGLILHIRHLGGTAIQSNGKNFVDASSRREISKWEAAIDELVNKVLIVGRGTNNEVYELSNLGFQIADMIEL